MREHIYLMITRQPVFSICLFIQYFQSILIMILGFYLYLYYLYNNGHRHSKFVKLSHDRLKLAGWLLLK